MTMISDEMLMAYVDGQIAAEDRVRVEAYLATDAESRTRLQVFIDTGPALARALDAATARPMPAWLSETVLGSAIALEESRVSRRADQGFGTLPAGGQSAGGLKAAIGRGIAGLWPVAAGAFASMLVGITIGWNLDVTGARSPARDLIISSADGQLRAGTDLSKALETAESGNAVALSGRDNAARVTPVLSFQSLHADVCRQYRISGSTTSGNGSGSSFEGIACRAADGTWQINMHAPSAARSVASDRISPASGPGDSIVDAVVDRLISGDAFSRDEEQRRLREKWSPPPATSDNSPRDRMKGGPATGN